MSASEWVHLDVELIVRETEKAFLLRLEGGAEYWIPRSQISEPENYEQGDEDVTISISQWIAEQKGLAD